MLDTQHFSKPRHGVERAQTRFFFAVNRTRLRARVCCAGRVAKYRKRLSTRPPTTRLKSRRQSKTRRASSRQKSRKASTTTTTGIWPRRRRTKKRAKDNDAYRDMIVNAVDHALEHGDYEKPSSTGYVLNDCLLVCSCEYLRVSALTATMRSPSFKRSLAYANNQTTRSTTKSTTRKRRATIKSVSNSRVPRMLLLRRLLVKINASITF